MERQYNIYSLKHPITLEIRYIGVTVKNPKERLYQHKYAALKKNSPTHVAKWLRKLYSEGLSPVVNLIEICGKENWEEREKYWIAQFSNLTNINEGGSGVVVDRDIDGKQRTINAHKKPVVLLTKSFEFIKEFDSGTECANYLNVTTTSVSNMISKRSFTVTGYVVLSKEEYDLGNYNKVYKGSHKTTYQYNLDGELIAEFQSIAKAWHSVKPSKYESGIHMAIRYKHSCGDFFWSIEKVTDFSVYRKVKKIKRNKI